MWKKMKKMGRETVEDRGGGIGERYRREG